MYAKDIRNIENNFISFLSHIFYTIEDAQATLEAHTNTRLNHTSYGTLWNKLVSELGERVAAAEAVFEMFMLHFDEEYINRVRQAHQEKIFRQIKTSDWAIVWDLFWESGKLRRLGQLLAEYIAKVEGREIDQEIEPSPEKQSEQSVDKLAGGQYEFDIALSYAGEDREYVERVADELRKRGVQVFYDKFNVGEMWGKSLPVHLDWVFRIIARYCIIFFSKSYVNKAWTMHELQSALERQVDGGGYILPVVIDKVDVPGLSLKNLCYLNVQEHSPEKIAEYTYRKVKG